MSRPPRRRPGQRMGLPAGLRDRLRASWWPATCRTRWHAECSLWGEGETQLITALEIGAGLVLTATLTLLALVAAFQPGRLRR